ncbi:MAG: BrxA/BrxB family bacilliredoxin [Bacteroidia bacterium]|jgi:putative YphP/YqiW family bacilliredoxin|nr:BrxA/BrxB family bacilliredoxin [Bacteroidia bacterium]
MPYPEMMVAPMRAELTNKGFTELKSAAEVEAAMNGNNDTTLVVVNSVCGCAAGSARPGILKSLEISSKKPVKLVTVFAGQDLDAVAKAREFMVPFPPSSPAVALFKNGEVVHMVERHMIEGRTADMVADNLAAAYEQFC